MITFVSAAFVLLGALAVVIGILDATNAPYWRLRAVERRRRWETQSLVDRRSESTDSDPSSRERHRDTGA